MTLKEAREIANRVRTKDWNIHQSVEMFDVTLILDDRIMELEAQLKDIIDWYDKDDDRLGDTSEIFEKARNILADNTGGK